MCFRNESFVQKRAVDTNVCKKTQGYKDMIESISNMDRYSDGEPKEIGEDTEVKSPLKTNYVDMAKRYALAERAVWAKTLDWKKEVIIDCRINETNDRIYSEYAQEIIRLAEDQKIKLDETLPAVPETPKATKVSDPVTI